MNRKQEREYLFIKMNGRCGYCGCELPERWHVDHIEPVVRRKLSFSNKATMAHPERDVIENKVASCPPCNMYKSSFSLKAFRHDLGNQVARLETYSTNYRLAIKYKQLNVTEQPIVFYFETLEKEESITS